MANIVEYRIQIIEVSAIPALAPNTINSWHIQDGAVGTTQIANNAVTTAKLEDGVVTTAKLADGAVTVAKLAAGLIQAAMPNSVNLPGAPTTTTAAAGTNTTQIATTQFVRTEIANLIAGAPGALDTLNELAVALQNEQSLSASFTTSLAGKAAIDAANLSAPDVTSWQAKLGLGAMAYLGSVNTAQIVDGAVSTVKVADDAITYAKIQNVSANCLLGNPTGVAGNATEIPLGAGLAWSGGALVASGGGANVAGSGTVNTIPKFTSVAGIGSSLLSDDGTSLVYSGKNFFVDNNSPVSYIRKLNAPANQKIWRTYVVDAQIVFDITNDAFAANQTYYTVQRSGASVTAQQWFIAGNERFSFDTNTIYARTSQYQLGYGVGAGVHIELGSTRTTDNYSLLDFHTVAGGATDFEARIIRWGGANGAFEFTNKGTGAIGLINIGAGDINFATSNTTRMRIYPDGGTQIGGTFGISPGAGITRIGDNTIWQGSIEVNAKGTGDRYAYIDFVGDDTYSDYGFRIVRGNTGPNTTSVIFHRGTGVFGLTAQDAAPISISTSSLERMRIYPDGGVQIGGTFGISPGPGALHLNGNGSVEGVLTASGFKIGANQVVGPRDTGWAAMTGTANKATVYDTASVTLAQLAGRVMSLQAALTAHGLIGA